MSQIRDLVKSLRTQGNSGGGKAQLDTSKLGKLSPSEVADLKELLKDPAMADKFSPEMRSTLESFVQGNAPVVRPVDNLVPDLGRMADPSEMPQRFASDFVVMREQLFDQRLTPDQKAERAFEFLSKYMERFVALATEEPTSSKTEKGEEGGEPKAPATVEATSEETPPRESPSGEAKRTRSVKGLEEVFEPGGDPNDKEAASFGLTAEGAETRKPLTKSEQTQHAQRFSTLAESVGFSELVDTRTGKTGASLAAELASSQDVRELRQRLTDVKIRYVGMTEEPERPRQEQTQAHAPSTSTRSAPVRELGEAAAARERRVELERVQNRQDLMRVQPWATEAGKVVVQPLERSSHSSDSETSSRGGFTDKRLGRNMVWNLLHRFRGKEQEESALTRDVWDKIAFSALMFLFGVALLVIVLVNL